MTMTIKGYIPDSRASGDVQIESPSREKQLRLIVIVNFTHTLIITIVGVEIPQQLHVHVKHGM